MLKSDKNFSLFRDALFKMMENPRSKMVESFLLGFLTPTLVFLFTFLYLKSIVRENFI